ncbi:MAG: hypothetical protein P0S94_00695, partial [Simkaniaceae bacterium]|nr:hypothetical protein [Simkaniaceae bacterium]
DAKPLNILGRGGTAQAIRKEALFRGRSLGPGYTINASSDPSLPSDFSVHHGTYTGHLLFCAQAAYQFYHWFPKRVDIKNNVTYNLTFKFLKEVLLCKLQLQLIRPPILK